VTHVAIDAYVLDAHGPVRGAEIKLLALPDGHCPCEAPFDASGYGNEMPSCACPEALASWRGRLAACEWPPPAVTTVATDVRGHAAISRGPGVTAIEVTRARDVRWIPWPAARSTLSLELAESIAPRVTVADDTTAQVHGAFLFDDGHCIPLVRTGDAWAPRVPIPKFEVSEGTLVVEAPGYATIVYSQFDQEQIDLVLHHERPVQGSCESGATARLDNPFQHLVTKVDANKQFTFTRVIDMASKVSCWADAQAMTEEWDFTIDEGLVEANLFTFGGYGTQCVEVKVVDGANRPVAGADISAMRDRGGGLSTGTGATTETNGIACIHDLDAGMKLTVSAPVELGGQCAGETSVKLEPRHLANPPVVMRLPIAKLPMARVHGRIVSPEGLPVVGASVSVTGAEPSATPDCGENGGGGAITALDGTFEFSAPRGKLELTIAHDWYLARELTIKTTGAAHDVVLQRGNRWTGHILDPEGKNIESCTLFLRLPGGRLRSTKCGKTGFAFGNLSAGDAEIQVRVENHPLGMFRTLRKKVHLGAGMPLVLDIAFPKGEDIAGHVVDSNGNAMPNIRVSALPKGVRGGQNTIHDDEVQLITDAFGRFRFRHLKPGTWTLHVNGRGGEQTAIDVVAGTKYVVVGGPQPPDRTD
jgi:hypothetical protein